MAAARRAAARSTRTRLNGLNQRQHLALASGWALIASHAITGIPVAAAAELPVVPAVAPVAAPAGTPPGSATAPPAPAPAPARINTGLVTIESDLQRADQTTGVVTATGNVRIVYPDQRVVATARQAQYFSQEGRVVLSGDVDIVQEGGNLIRAERVIYQVGNERLVAIPPEGQQVFSRLRMQQTPPAASPTPPSAPAPSAPAPAVTAPAPTAP